jgi:hypothetical protein
MQLEEQDPFDTRSSAGRNSLSYGGTDLNVQTLMLVLISFILQTAGSQLD